MSLNYILARHQISLMRADAASCAPSRMAHARLANAYAAEINRVRATGAALAAPLPSYSQRVAA